MRRVLVLVALVLAAPAPAAAQWGEAPAVALGSSRPATCLRDAGAAHVSALARRGSRYGAALYAAGPDGLRPAGEALFGRRVAECPVAAADASGAAVVAAPSRASAQRRRPQRLLVAVRDPGAGFAAPVEVARMPSPSPRARFQAAVAVAPDGSALVAWQERHEAGPGRGDRVTVRVVRRGPGEPFGAPQTLLDRAPGRWTSRIDVTARLDGAGGATVAWARPRPRRRRGRMEGLSSIVVAAAAPGARFARPSVVADHVQDVTVVALAVAPDGRALLAHDGGLAVRVYERAPGAPAFGPAATFGGRVESPADRPAVALGPDGSAVVAWRAEDSVDAVVRTGTGGWAPVARVQRAPRPDPGGLSFGADVDDGPPIDRDDGRPRAAAAAGGRAAVGWREPSTPAGGPARAWVATASAGTFAPATALGSPVRDADAVQPAIGAGGPAAVWADNGAVIQPDLPVGDGRLRLAHAAEPLARVPAPRVRVTARPQSLYHREPLVVDVDCAAACDLRAVVAPRPSRGDDADLQDGGPPGPAVGIGCRGDAGRVTLRVEPASGTHIAPPGGGTVRVVVRAAAPGGARASRTVLAAPVRRRPAPPLRAPLDVRARRAGDAVIVTWRTDGPARRMLFLAFTRRTRGRNPTRASSFGQRHGRRRQHFRLRLDDAPRARFVVLHAAATDPPPRQRLVLVPIR